MATKEKQSFWDKYKYLIIGIASIFILLAIAFYATKRKIFEREFTLFLEEINSPREFMPNPV